MYVPSAQCSIEFKVRALDQWDVGKLENTYNVLVHVQLTLLLIFQLEHEKEVKMKAIVLKRSYGKY